MEKYLRSDLALELNEEIEDSSIDNGIEIKNIDNYNGKIRESIIYIKNSIGAELLGKPVGTYITIEGDELCKEDEDVHQLFSQCLRDNLDKLLKGSKKILVVGMGNRFVTPDALGPYVVDNLFVTRHLISEGIIKNSIELSAIAPGVMAQTGVETQEILQSLCSKIKPDIVIAIDALAAREPSRLGRTIQICDTGISPGSGVGNQRAKLDATTLGVKVIAIGVPTVISVPAIVNQVVDDMLNFFMSKPGGDRIELTDEEKYNLSCNFLEKNLISMFVTPKNIDESVKRISFTISEAINSFFEL
ncbi:MAG: GPR endopeptidase [Lachnospiraceae bacterium]|nr:GPR endopeptidase [Lachnospiraceae bacterium]MBQ8318293.1 GPR endopeptidase [Lachnospiraceae bacterium]